MSRIENVEIFRSTMQMCEEAPRLKESINHSISGQRFYPESSSIPFNPPLHSEGSAAIVVTTCRSFEAASKYKGKKVAVLNFASWYSPGGGVQNGSSAQEESLCRVSTLYPCISSSKMKHQFYHPHRDLDNPVANGDIIYTPGVTVFRSDSEPEKILPEDLWFDVDVVTCAAPNLSRINMSDADLAEIHLQRLKRILQSAIAGGCTHIILGAFGCGVFNNNPRVVAKAHSDVLSEMSRYFEVIEYAVYCSRYDADNYKAFNEILGR